MTAQLERLKLIVRIVRTGIMTQATSSADLATRLPLTRNVAALDGGGVGKSVSPAQNLLSAL